MVALWAEIFVSELYRKYVFISHPSINEQRVLEAGKKSLAGNTTREATSVEESKLRKENQQLKHILANLIVALGHYKKNCPSRTNCKTQEIIHIGCSL